jgi:putative addiction module component (TIGR02574 family)
MEDENYGEVEDFPLADWQVAELERRLAESELNPPSTTPWEVIRDRAFARSRESK